MLIDRAITAIGNNKARVMTSGDLVNQTQMSALISAVNKSNSLEHLTFNPDTAENTTQITTLFQTLKRCDTLQSLTIDLSKPLTTENVEALGEMIQSHLNLRKLLINGETLSDDTLPKLINYLNQNRGLKQLSCCISKLSDDVILDASIQLIAHSKIKELYFFPKYATCEQIKSVADALSKNNTLNSLCLALSGYESDALKPLIDCIKEKKHSLSELSLFTIDDVTLRRLVEVVKSDNTLQKLSIEVNPTMENLNLVKDMVLANSTLIRLDYCVSYHSLEEAPEWLAIEEAISDKIMQNRARIATQKTVEHDKKTTKNKRPASVLQPQTSPLPNKRQHISEEPDTEKENNKHLPPPIAT